MTETPNHRPLPGRARPTPIPAATPKAVPVVGAVRLPEQHAAPVASPAPLVAASTGPRVGRPVLRARSIAPIVAPVPEGAAIEQVSPPAPVEVMTAAPAPTSTSPKAVEISAPRVGRCVGPATLDWRGSTSKVEAPPAPEPSFVDDLGDPEPARPTVDLSSLPPMPPQQHNAHCVERHARRAQAPLRRTSRTPSGPCPPVDLDDPALDPRNIPF